MRSGESPYQYIRNRRLKLAQHLLEEEPATKIYQIARRTGFTSAKQLSMAFCQEFGHEPARLSAEEERVILPPSAFPLFRYSATWNCMVRASATRFEASSTSSPTRLPAAS